MQIGEDEFGQPDFGYILIRECDWGRFGQK